MKILVTGSSGFIGSFIVEEALRQGMEVWAAIRKSSSRKYLTDERIKFICLNLSSEEDLKKELSGMDFDYIVHAAGVTKCINASEFGKVNTQGTINLIKAIIALQMPIRRFVYLSSLSVCGPIREDEPHKEISDSDIPRPNTAYGKSKLDSERFLESLDAFPYIILRPTGVYGPRESDYFMMAKSIRNHVDFAAGYRRQDITFVYVDDVVQAVFLALTKGRDGGRYFLSDGNVYDSRMFSDLVRHELGDPWLIRIKAPLWLLRIITFAGEYVGKWTGRISALNNDKYNIMRQRNWMCDIRPTIDELGYKPQYDLAKGVGITIRWCLDNGWL